MPNYKSLEEEKNFTFIIQAHLISVINKICALPEYQGALQYSDALALLLRTTQVILHG
jgi:hypothetical protein